MIYLFYRLQRHGVLNHIFVACSLGNENYIFISLARCANKELLIKKSPGKINNKSELFWRDI